MKTLITAISLAFSAYLNSTTAFAAAASEQAVGYGVAKFAGVTPQSLLLGKRTSQSAEKCVHEVVITDPKAACTVNRCINNVFHAHASPETLSYGLRGLLIYDCATADVFSTQGDLLTDHDSSGETVSNIAIFQVDQVGKGLWKQVFKNGEYAIELPTEAGPSYLKYTQGQYRWAH
ncbi:MAG TPA: hypothetical protein VGE55_05505 [Limnobacter sp.]|uniref:hypothetical protein n=1 Tax=Limnobacter sp. TaxID=2003368 RepID=UPI002ED90B76